MSSFHHKNGLLDDTNDFLRCDEVWDMSPIDSSSRANDHHINTSIHGNLIHHITKEDCEHSFATFLQKEMKYMPRSGYVNFLESDHFVANCRFKAIQWFIFCQRRFNFCIGTVFKAVNYVDRFIDINQCHGWTHWMMELLSLASLSIAMKFGETCPPSLHEIQEGLDHSFEARLIKKMELKMLMSLKWELDSTTPYSFAELINWEMSSHFKPIVLEELSSKLNDILLASSFEVKMLIYRPSVIVMSGVRCVLEEFHPSTYQNSISHITSFTSVDQEKTLQSCYNMMQEMLVSFRKSNANPSSPDTVLTKEQVAIYEKQVDLSFIDGHAPMKKNNVKRKRGEDNDCVVKCKK